MGDLFTVTLGRWHDVLVGPHRQSMYQVAFAREEFPRLVPWLMLNREGLSILVHPLTGDELRGSRDPQPVARSAAAAQSRGAESGA